MIGTWNMNAQTDTLKSLTAVGSGIPSLPLGLDHQSKSFAIASLQILDEEGNVDESLEPDLPADRLQYLYESMYLARVLDERSLNLQRQGRIGTFVPSSGQEAAVCGPALAMRPTDWFVGAFREAGARLMRGEPIEKQLLFFAGYEEGNTFEGGERTLPISIIIAGQCLHAVGIAYAMRIRGENDTAVLCTFGDGATSEGDFHEALNFAAVWQVPVVFVCQNNQWAISVPRSSQTRSETIAQKAIAYGMPGIQVDGNDALAMYKAADEAFSRARDGGGPTLIEAVTYRQKMHTTADDPKRYQDPAVLEAWLKRDPIIRFRRHLENKGIWSDQKQEAMEQHVKEIIDNGIAAFEAASDFRPDAPFDYAFGTTVARLEEQRAEFLDNIKREAAHG